MNKRYFVTRCIGIFIFVVVSCKPDNLPSKTESHSTVTTSPSFTITPKPIETLTKTALPSSTLTISESKNFIKEYLTNNSSCKLPCWLDVTPGETTLLEVEELLRYIGILFDSKGVPGYTSNSTFHGTNTLYYKNIVTDFSFEVIDKIVNAILIRSYTYEPSEEFKAFWKKYSLENILKEYGVPDRILLNVTGSYNFGRTYQLWVFYDSKKIMIRYDGRIYDSGINDNPILRICPMIDGMNPIGITLQDSKSSLPIERFDAILGDIRPQIETGITRVVYSIQEATGMNEKEYHDLFMQEDELICFETPSDIWDTEQ